MKVLTYCVKITSSIFLGWIFNSISVLAQTPPIQADGTTNSVVNLQGQVYEITGTNQSAQNLFHSLQFFSVPQGNTAYFRVGPGQTIENIISRVTGGSASTIDGTIQADANLLLINPYGIIFGSEAKLNINGSFLGSTANSFTFPDGTQFSATNPQAPPLLTVNVPIGLQFGSNVASIQVQGSTLEVPANQTLALVGGDVNLTGGRVLASGGRVELGGLVGAGTVDYLNGILRFPENGERADVVLTNQTSVNVTGANGGSIAINAQKINLLENSSLLSGIEAGAGSPDAQAGDITLNATGAITLDSSAIANNVGELDSNSTIVTPVAIGNSGNIIITAESLSLTNNASLDAGIFGEGNAGSILVQAEGLVSLDNSRMYSDVFQGAVGNAGDIIIGAGAFSLTGGAELIATYSSSEVVGNVFTSSGFAGNVLIEARNQISIEDSRIDSTSNNDDTSGDFSLIRIAAPEGSVNLKNANLNTNNLGLGYAGDIVINARDEVAITNETTILSEGQLGRLIISQSDDYEDSFSSRSVRIENATLSTTNFASDGNAGDITIDALETVNVTNSLISSDAVKDTTVSEGSAGFIGITANDNVAIANTWITVDSSGFEETADELPEDDSILSGASAQAGSIVVGARTISVTDGSLLTSTALSSGYAGSIILLADDKVKIEDSNLFSDAYNNETNSGGLAGFIGVGANNSISLQNTLITAESFGIANGNLESGSIALEARSILLGRNSTISTTIYNEGFAGNVFVSADKTLSLSDQSQIISDSQGAGEAGFIGIDTGSLVLMRRNSLISTSANNDGTPGAGGNITINTKFLVGLSEEDSDITANANFGSGGFIQINAQGVYGLKFQPQLTSMSDITAFSQLSPELNGIVEINTPDVDPSSGLTELPSDVVDASELIAQDLCRPKQQESSFVVTGRGGTPANPREILAPETTIVEWATGETEEQGSREVEERIQSSAINENQQLAKGGRQIVEAQGWIVAADGTVILSANPPSVTPHSPRVTSPSCQ